MPVSQAKPECSSSFPCRCIYWWPQGGLCAQWFPSPFPTASSLVLLAPTLPIVLIWLERFMTVARTSLARRSGMGRVTHHPDLLITSCFSTESPMSWETPETQANKDSGSSYILYQNWYYVARSPLTTLSCPQIISGKSDQMNWKEQPSHHHHHRPKLYLAP